MFFLMTWSTLKLPILIYQITELGLKLSLIMNGVMLLVFIIASILIDKIISEADVAAMLEKNN